MAESLVPLLKSSAISNLLDLDIGAEHCRKEGHPFLHLPLGIREPLDVQRTANRIEPRRYVLFKPPQCVDAQSLEDLILIQPVLFVARV
jgi:hypothetical protein